MATALSLSLSTGLAPAARAQDSEPTVIPEAPLNLPPKPKPLHRSYAPPISAEPAPPTVPRPQKAAKARPRPKQAPPKSAAQRLAPIVPAQPGNLTRAVQKALTRAGHIVPRNGKRDNRTRQALRKYRADHRLPVAGKIDRATKARLGIR